MVGSEIKKKYFMGSELTKSYYKGQVIWSSTPAVVLDADYQVLYNSYVVKPSAERMLVENARMIKLKESGIFAESDILLFFDGETEDQRLRNWKNPGQKATLFGTVNWTSNGYKGNNLDFYINSGFTPSTSGSKYQRDNASMSMYVSEASILNTAQSLVLCGLDGDGLNRMTADSATAQRINQSNVVLNVATAFSGSGRKRLIRTSASDVYTYGSTVDGPKTASSSAMASRPQLILRSNTAYGDSRIKDFIMGSAMLDKNTAFNNIYL